MDSDFEQVPSSPTNSSVMIANFIQTMTGGSVQGAAGSQISMTQNVQPNTSALMQRFDELTDQLTEILIQTLKGSDLRNAVAEVSTIQSAVKASSPEINTVAKESHSLGERLLAVLDIGDKMSGSIQTAIYATEALVVLGGWLNTAYQVLQHLAG